MAIIDLTLESFDASVSGGSCIVDFWASWCGPCQLQASVLEQFAEKHDGKITVGKVDIESQRELARRHGVMSIPTIAAFADGKLTEKRVGVQSIEALESMVFGS